MTSTPVFSRLPTIPTLGYRHSWDVFGPDDNLGTLNWLTPDRTLAALEEARSGLIVNLNLPLHEPDPPLFGRQPMVQLVESHGRNSFDDKLDNFYLQSTTQWDGFLHQRAREFGFYGGRLDDPVPGSLELGVDHWARHGLVGRGVLIDVPRWKSFRGEEYDPFSRLFVPHDEIAEVAAHQGVVVQPGDILCIRFGWVDGWLKLSRHERVEMQQRLIPVETRTFAGLAADEGMSAYLWNHRVVAIACDNPAVEGSPGDPAVGSLHRRLIPCLGFLLGELFDLGELARLCAERRQWTFVFTSSPLNLVGGVGTPANAYAVL